MLESMASPETARLYITKSPECENIKRGTLTANNFPTRAALATTLLTGCRAKEIVSVVAPSEAREGIVYGVRGTDLSIEEYEGEEYLVINVIVLKKHLMTTSSRIVAIPRRSEYEPLAPIVEDAFKRADDAPVFPFTRQIISASATNIFNGLNYYIHPYLRFEQEGKMGFEVKGHPRNMAIHALRHIREQELEDTFHLEDRQIQAYFKWSNRYMGISEVMGRYRGHHDWHMYAQKLLKKRS